MGQNGYTAAQWSSRGGGITLKPGLPTIIQEYNTAFLFQTARPGQSIEAGTDLRTERVKKDLVHTLLDHVLPHY